MHRPTFIPSKTAIPSTMFEFLDAVKVSKGLTSDFQLYKAMRWNQAAISGWRQGRTLMSAPYGIRIADELRIPRPYVLACLEAERERDPVVADVWREIAQRYREDILRQAEAA